MENSFIALKTERLDKFLVAQFPLFSRTYLKEQIKLGNILIGGKIVKPSYKLREGDRVAFAPEFPLPQSPSLVPNPDIKLIIIYENDDVLILDKPAGLAMHPRQQKDGSPLLSEIDKTLVSGLLARYPEIKNVGDAPLLRPGIVHRLDKDTSGVLIVAKNQKSFDWLKNQFKERKTEKKYLALVRGLPKNQTGKITQNLSRSKKNPTKQKISKEGKEAITYYKVIKQFKDFSLLEIRPKTGRLHQIRVHLNWLGYPVAGDKKYGPQNQLLPQGLNRQFLHASELKIALPQGQEKKFESSLPPDLKQVLEGLIQNLEKTSGIC